MSTLSRRIPLLIAAAAAAATAVACSESGRELHPSRAGAIASTAARLPSITESRVELASTRAPLRSSDPAVEREPAPAKTVSAREETPSSFNEILAFAKSADRSEVDVAIEALVAARELEPESALPDIEAARLHLRHGRATLARGFAERGVERDPESSYAWNTLGRVDLAEGDYSGAVAAFERAVECSESNSFAWNNLGLAYMRLEQFEEAAFALERATSGARPEAYMWNNLGMAYERLFRFDLATAAYRQAADQGSPTAVANLDRLLETGHIRGGDDSDYPGEDLGLGVAAAE